MSESPEQKRLVSLDVFSGMTIAGMVLVNNPGTWSAIYSPLKHAEWHGWTPTDFVFPFFVFIMGVAIPIALGKRLETGVTGEVYWKIFKRAALIFLLGLIQMGFPFFDTTKTEMPLVIKIVSLASVAVIIFLFFTDRFRLSAYVTLGLFAVLGLFYLFNQGFPLETFQKLRIMGVLQRLALCYLFASLIFLWTNWKQQIYIAVGLLLFYWLVMIYGTGGDLSMEGNFSGVIDRLILGENHIYRPTSKFYDPEGIFSTLPAIASCLAGVLCGQWLKTERSDLDKVSGMFFWGVVLLSIGWIWNFWFPINKPIWTSSYVAFMAGLALLYLALCYWLIDIKNYRKWTTPFVIFGTNALALYFGSAIFARILARIQWPAADGKTTNAQQWIYNTFFAPFAEPVNASLAFAISYILFWLFLMWLLYRKRIFIKV
jgi:predicted acyltransferase